MNSGSLKIKWCFSWDVKPNISNLWNPLLKHAELLKKKSAQRSTDVNGCIRSWEPRTKQPLSPPQLSSSPPLQRPASCSAGRLFWTWIYISSVSSDSGSPSPTGPLAARWLSDAQAAAAGAAKTVCPQIACQRSSSQGLYRKVASYFRLGSLASKWHIFQGDRMNRLNMCD